jgi:hypothetical protein
VAGVAALAAAASHAFGALRGGYAGAVIFFAFGRLITVVSEGGSGRCQQSEGEQRFFHDYVEKQKIKRMG